MTTDATRIAKSILGGTQQLMGELSRGVVDVIVSNAPQIDSFNARREELTEFEAEYLFYYAFGLVMFSKTIQKSWSGRDVAPILEAAADELSRRIAYSSRSEADLKNIQATVLHNLRNMYEATQQNYGRIFAGEEQTEEDIFNVVTLNLMRAFPGISSLLMEQPALFSVIMQQFGTLSLAGAIGASGTEIRAEPPPPRSGGFLRGLFSRG